MKQKLCQAIILTETKELVNQIAAVTNEKKYAIYEKAIRDYAQKKQIEVAAGN